MVARGAFHVLLLYDVAESFDLESLRGRLGPQAEAVKPVFPRGTPQYVRFEQPPLVEPADPLPVGGELQLRTSIKYYGFGTVVVELEAPFESDWNNLPGECARWMETGEVEQHARRMLTGRLQRVAPAVIRPIEEWLQEDYFVIELHEAARETGGRMTGADLVSAHGVEIAQIVRGETAALAPRGAEEVLSHSLSYYASDLVVVGSTAALVYDNSEDAAATMQVLEYARMQLLEFRYYDRLMTRVLADVYTAQERKRNILLSRWTLPRETRRVNTIRLDVMELTERIDNAIKFVSDVYYARVYQLAAGRMGVNDYRNLVEGKLRTVGELYDFMMDQFNEARSFVLEVIVMILAVLDVILLFQGR